jgi:hypothetical protein
MAGLGSEPGTFFFVYFLISLLYRWSTAAPRHKSFGEIFKPDLGQHLFHTKSTEKMYPKIMYLHYSWIW